MRADTEPATPQATPSPALGSLLWGLSVLLLASAAWTWSTAPVGLRLLQGLTVSAAVGLSVAVTRARRADQRRIETLRAELRDQSRETLAMQHHRSEFITNMSHELRTPLAGILGLVELSQAGSIDPARRRHLSLIKDSTRSLITIVDDLLDVGRIESGALRLHPGRVDMAQLIERTLGFLAPRATAKGLSLGCQIDDELPPFLKADPVRIRQVLLNLVGNGIKFTESGRVDLRALWSADDSRLRFEIEDTGIGIAPSAVPRLFTPFQQADTSTSRQFGGTGLGLSISKRLVELMGGSIGVESQRGAGSTFWFELPLSVVHSDQPTHRDTVPTDGRLSGVRILVVEDDPINRLVVVAKLESFGVEVTTAEDGREALDRLADDRFDLVIMDCQIPEIDGYEATRRLRRSGGPAASIPVVALTAHSHSDERGRCLAAGMNDYLTKPVSSEDLFSTLDNWLASDAVSATRSAEGERS